MYNNLKGKALFSYVSFKKRYFYIKKINNYIFRLKNIFNQKQKYKSSNSLLFDNQKGSKDKKVLKGLIIMYIISFSFTATNTFLHITDTAGNLKFCCSAGFVDFKGKQKKTRMLVLGRFLSILRQLKLNFLKNKPVALHLNNVESHKYFIIKNLKKYFFIIIIKHYESYSYNGCRKKKKIRKRQRLKKR